MSPCPRVLIERPSVIPLVLDDENTHNSNMLPDGRATRGTLRFTAEIETATRPSTSDA